MFIVYPHKTIYPLIICALLISQPLHPIFADKKYDHAVFCLFFIGGCAILGMISSYFKKLEPTTTKQKKSRPSRTKISYDELEQKIAALSEAHKETKNFELTVKQAFALQGGTIRELTQKCDELTEKNKQLSIAVKSMRHEANGYVPALVAAYWFYKYTEQTKINNNYKQNTSNNNSLLLTKNE